MIQSNYSDSATPCSEKSLAVVDNRNGRLERGPGCNPAHLVGAKRYRFIFFILVIMAFIPAVDAAYMLGKATLAQRLIERSWLISGNSSGTANKPWPWADTYPVAKIAAPSVELEAWVLAGASGHSLSFGPGLADGSVAPGEAGVVMIAGHRDTSFQPLADIQVGASVYLQNESRQTFHYRVTSLAIVDSRNTTVETQVVDPALLLVTCFPFNALTAGGPMRYVVEASLVTEAH